MFCLEYVLYHTYICAWWTIKYSAILVSHNRQYKPSSLRYEYEYFTVVWKMLTARERERESKRVFERDRQITRCAKYVYYSSSSLVRRADNAINYTKTQKHPTCQLISKQGSDSIRVGTMWRIYAVILLLWHCEPFYGTRYSFVHLKMRL